MPQRTAAEPPVASAPFPRPGTRVVIGSAVVAATLGTLFFFPRYWLWCLAGAPLGDVVSIQPEFNRAYFALQQLQDPWQRIDNVTHRVIEWRLLFPVVGHYLGLPPAAYLAVPHVGCLAALTGVAFWTWRATRDARTTAGAALLAATSSWFFVSIGWLAYFDSWVMLALLAATFARSAAILFPVALLAPWIDERFILALPLCAALRALPAVADAAGLPRFSWRDARWLLAGIAPYLVIRLSLELGGGRGTSGSYWQEHAILAAPVEGIVLGLWHGLRFGWIAVVFVLALAWRGRNWLILVAMVAALLVNLAVADDFSRSASVAVPVLVAGVIVFSRTQPLRAGRVLPWICAGNLLLPAAHIIATPGSPVERFHRAPILYLYAERENAKNPPEFANAAVYTRRGLEALQAGRLDLAGPQFDLALRIDPGFSRARAHRGMVLYLKGQKAAGLAEMDRALNAAPDLFDVRLQRATFRQEMGNLGGARDDVREALRQMPADWPKRREAEAFEQQLNASSR